MCPLHPRCPAQEAWVSHLTAPAPEGCSRQCILTPPSSEKHKTRVGGRAPGERSGNQEASQPAGRWDVSGAPAPLQPRPAGGPFTLRHRPGGLSCPQVLARAGGSSQPACPRCTRLGQPQGQLWAASGSAVVPEVTPILHRSPAPFSLASAAHSRR